MPAPEGPPIPQEGEPEKEQEPPPYHVAAHYAEPQEQLSASAYNQTQRLIARENVDLSTYRLQLPPIAPGWYVAVLGEPPSEEIHAQLLNILSSGEPTTLPAQVLNFLQERRRQASQIAPWVEGHYRPGKKRRLRAPEPRDTGGPLLPPEELLLIDE